ncbi:MAG: glycoside hydrolase 43 family protein [Treponema sp.]|nr:glycoside hydrolase 43 family protein [Treponema sp.]
MKNKTYKTSSSYIIPSDFPDLDVIRVEDTYYMVSTTMHFMPGCVILRSYNLVDWEHAAYLFDKLEDTPGQNLKDNKGIYGKGMWAASLRYHKGKFYISFVANDTHKTYLFTADQIEGPWKRSEIQGFYHDMSLLFDDDGKVYCVSGNTNITLTELKDDLSGPKENGINKVIIQDNPEEVALGYEGCHFYKINGKYYVFMIHIPKNKMRTQACYFSDKIDGPYTGGDVLCSDLGGWNSGTAQGGIVQANDGKWYSILFQDHGALGRIPVLIPVSFEKDFPIFGTDGKAPEIVKVLDNRPDYKYKSLYSNDFTNSAWQFNHNPDKSLINLSKDTYTIKTDKTCINPIQAANTLTQRAYTEHCSGSITLDISNINDGDLAGLCALEGEYGFIAITKINGKYKLIEAEHKISYSQWAMGVVDQTPPDIIAEKEIGTAQIQLKLTLSLEYQKENAIFSYFDKESKTYIDFGKAVKLRYTLDQFVGVRFALFYYSNSNTGGSATFKDFKYDIL